MDKGLLIAFEGVDKAGKGTQSRMLAEKLNATRIAFPRYDTLVGKVIRRHLDGHVALAYEHSIDSSFPERDGQLVYRVDHADPLMFQCLMLADKMHAATEIRALLERGQHVVLDRWIDSALAYGAADGLDPGWLETIHAPLPVSDVTVFLDIAPELTRQRGRAPGDSRGKDDRYERDLPRLKTVYENYKKLYEPNEFGFRPRNCWAFDGRDLVDTVSRDIWGIVGPFTR